MDLTKIITICAFCIIFGMEFVLSSPTFGSEHVHIKVLIPHEHAGGKGHIKSKHPVIHHVPKHHVKHKIIHHYHTPPKQVKTVVVKEKAPILENLYLAELDKPHSHEPSYHQHGPKHIEETYIVKEQHQQHIKPVEEVKVVEEYEHQHQPHHEYGQNHVETIKLIESGQDHHHYQEDHDQHHHHYQPHHEYGKNHIETIKLVESAQDHHQHQYHEDHDHHVKFVEEKPQYHYHHKEMPANYDYHVPKDEVIKVIQAPKYIPTKQSHSHYVHEPQVKEVVEEEEIIETKPSPPKGYYKNQDLEDHILPDIIEESLEIFETKKAKNHNYNNNHYQPHYGYQQSKGEVITKPLQHHYQKVPATNYHYSHKPQVHKEEHIEYEKPNPHHYPQHPETSHHYSSHSDTYEEDSSSHENQHKFVTDYEKYLPSSETPQDFNGAHKEYQKQNTLYEDFNTKDDYSNAVDNVKVNPAETYTGHDSYSAGHVQGLGSGGYRYHMP